MVDCARDCVLEEGAVVDGEGLSVNVDQSHVLLHRLRYQLIPLEQRVLEKHLR